MPHPSPLEAHAEEAANLLRLLANERRLLLLCELARAEEMTVGRLAARIGLSQAALSQHLTRLRAEGLVERRREGTSLYYRIADPRVAAVMGALQGLFCPNPATVRAA
ncbi:MAG: metalloregulator ArsR/SmtB family transcription factor [Rhodovarius sp.]|nr:metalloregulator ArsR/SmtB family transcription factor [Rhodovarius sp.]MDW8314903.1 metalloregulator ArsR/SmtB family transcription factor [Rhodovarius sp.]